MGGKSAFLGIVAGIGAILLSVILEGGELVALLNLPAAVLVLGGTVGAALTCHSLEDCKRAIKGLGMIMRYASPRYKDTEGKLMNAADVSRRNGLLALENMDFGDPYLNQGLQMATDGLNPELIASILSIQIEMENEEVQRTAAIFDTLGSYAPTMGIVGTVVGLIHVLANLEDAAALGHSIASAFAATLYGIAGANLLFLPLGARIRDIAQETYKHREMMREGILSICDGDNSRVVELKMSAFQNERPENSPAAETTSDAV